MISYIALGSNLHNPLQQMSEALIALAQLPQTQLLATSSFYRTQPVGVGTQPDFINAVASIETQLIPHLLLQQLVAIEHAQGRQRISGVWGQARTLDLDILLYGDLQLDDQNLTIPHPRMYDRAFVLYPLADIAPTLQFPDGRLLTELLLNCSEEGLERLPTG